MTSDTEKMIAVAIDDAEDIADPLDGLVEKVATDAGAPFVPDVLERLCELKRQDPKTGPPSKYCGRGSRKLGAA